MLREARAGGEGENEGIAPPKKKKGSHMKILRPGRKGVLWFFLHILSILFLSAWVLYTISTGAHWFLTLFGGVLLAKVASDFVRGLRMRRRAEDAEEEAQEKARLHGLPASVVKAVWAAILVSGSFLLVILFAGALNAALNSKGSWAVWIFPVIVLCMLGGLISLACIVLRGLPGKKRPQRDPTSEIRWPIFCFGICFAIVGSIFIAAYLTTAVPQGQPWTTCLIAVPHVAVGVASAVSAVRKPSRDAPEGDALPRTCPRCEATVPVGARVCPRCGKRVRAGKAKTGT